MYMYIRSMPNIGVSNTSWTLVRLNYDQISNAQVIQSCKLFRKYENHQGKISQIFRK